MATATADLLDTYRKKRDFSKTREPGGGTPAARGEELFFCVQKHDATRLHYDFRIEWEGVLKSWAVTKGPSLDPSDKRLAVRTEDHPLDYGTFEGTIPKGEYGGGTVMLWDAGRWEPREDPEEGFRKGSLKMRLYGERMHGEWALVRMKPRGREKRENWLLIKEKGPEADRRRNILSAAKSVKTGRTMAAIAKGDDVWENRKEPQEQAEAQADDPAPAEVRETAEAGPDRGSKLAARKRPAKAPKHEGQRPKFVAPQLATLVDAAPEGGDWLHELKYDGYRVIIAVGAGGTRCYTRNEKDWTDKFAAITEAAEALSCDTALIDGEIVAFDADGRTDFSTLQHHLSEGGPLSCFCFDLLALDGEDLAKRPLTERKAKLKDLLARSKSKVLLYSEDVKGSGAKVLAELCRAGQEGIVSKRADAPYRSGRTRSWLKAKCTRRQEFVIGGWSPTDKKSRPFSSILLGVVEDGKLIYRGRVGSGFDTRQLEDLGARFAKLARKTSPFADLPRDIARRTRFVAPELVAEIDFTEITADGHVRHGVFKGLREDKEADEVRDETPKPAEAPERERKGAPKEGGGSPRRRRSGGADDVVAGVKLSHPDRVVFDGQGVTKGDLAALLRGRRRPDARPCRRPAACRWCAARRASNRHCFFQKHDSGGFPDGVGTVEVDGEGRQQGRLSDPVQCRRPRRRGADEHARIPHLGLAQRAGWRSPTGWSSTSIPTRGSTFGDVKTAAFDMRDRLADLGLATFPMVTGGKGVHVVAPLERRQGWDEVKAFARGFAHLLAREEPDRYVADDVQGQAQGPHLRRLAAQRARLDRHRPLFHPLARGRTGGNARHLGRARRLDRANGFDTEAVIERLDDPDPWADYGGVRQSMTKAMLKTVAE